MTTDDPRDVRYVPDLLSTAERRAFTEACDKIRPKLPRRKPGDLKRRKRPPAVAKVSQAPHPPMPADGVIDRAYARDALWPVCELADGTRVRMLREEWPETPERAIPGTQLAIECG